MFHCTNNMLIIINNKLLLNVKLRLIARYFVSIKLKSNYLKVAIITLYS